MSGRILLFFVAVVFSLLLTPLIRALAVWLNILDLPSERKIHKKPVPLLGGIPIFLSFNLAVILGLILDQSLLSDPVLSKWHRLLICQIIILGLGFVDDWLHLQPWTKFVFQIFVGVLIVLFGFGIHNITNPFNGLGLHLGLFSVPITIFWLVLITNALNLVDGLDGLAAGTSFIVAMTVFAICYFTQSQGIAFVSLVLAGSILGFLKYNFYPAKIFLGDSGSLLLGFLLAVLSIQGSTKGAAAIAILTPILALGFPIMETLLSMIRRLLKSIRIIDYPANNGTATSLSIKGFSPFKADKDHVHHRLLQLGFSQRKAVIILYGACGALSVLAFISVAIKNINVIALMGAVVIAFFIGIRSLKYQEFKILESGLLIPVFNFPIINRRTFQGFFDLCMILFSAYLSFVLVFGGFNSQAKVLFIQSIPILLLSKMIIFYLFGLYRETWAHFSLEEILSLIGGMVCSSLSLVIIAALIFGLDAFGGIIFFVLDFYLLLTLVGGFRVSYRILNTYYKKSFAQKGKKVVIYGAGYRGSTVLKEIRNNTSYRFLPLGFIDDDPGKKGKILHGCPILGSFDDLEEISSGDDVSEIIISTAKIGKEKINKLTEFCRKKQINVRQFEFRFYEFP